jgi:hypothetical protein
MSAFLGNRARPVAVLALAVAGCGDPYADSQKPAPPPGEQPASRLPDPTDRVAVQALAPTPEGAARRAAELATNWTGETAARNYAKLARVTVGAARRSARESAARLPTDSQLSAPGARSSGTVEAIATHSTGARRRQLVVVTRETLVADGVRDERWRVTLATAERRRGGWVIARWEPQP